MFGVLTVQLCDAELAFLMRTRATHRAFRHGIVQQPLARDGVEQTVDPAAAGEQGARDAGHGVAGRLAAVGHAPHATHGQRQREQDVHAWVQDHQRGDALDGGDVVQVRRVEALALRRSCGRHDVAGPMAQDEERQDVEQNGAEFEDENPDVVQAKPVLLERGRDPAPRSGAHKVLLPVDADADAGE